MICFYIFSFLVHKNEYESTDDHKRDQIIDGPPATILGQTEIECGSIDLFNLK